MICMERDMTQAAGAIDQQVVQEILRRVVSAVQPVRVILFGSMARAEAKVGSDYDILVIVPDGTHRLHTAQRVHRAMMGIGVAVDVVVATPAVLARYRDAEDYVYASALREGRELYAA